MTCKFGLNRAVCTLLNHLMRVLYNECAVFVQQKPYNRNDCVESRAVGIISLIATCALDWCDSIICFTFYWIKTWCRDQCINVSNWTFTQIFMHSHIDNAIHTHAHTSDWNPIFDFKVLLVCVRALSYLNFVYRMFRLKHVYRTMYIPFEQNKSMLREWF